MRSGERGVRVRALQRCGPRLAVAIGSAAAAAPPLRRAQPLWTFLSITHRSSSARRTSGSTKLHRSHVTRNSSVNIFRLIRAIARQQGGKPGEGEGGRESGTDVAGKRKGERGTWSCFRGGLAAGGGGDEDWDGRESWTGIVLPSPCYKFKMSRSRNGGKVAPSLRPVAANVNMSLEFSCYRCCAFICLFFLFVFFFFYFYLFFIYIFIFCVLCMFFLFILLFFNHPGA